MEISDPKWSMGAEGARISFRVPTVAEAKAQCEAMVAGKRYALTVKELTKKRSLSANALMWAVLGEMAAALNQSGSRVTPDEIYRGYIRQTPNYYVAECWEDTLGKLQSTWEATGLAGWRRPRSRWTRRTGWRSGPCGYGTAAANTTPAKWEI